MGNNEMILGEDMYYDLDTHKTKLNNNVLVVGASGTGKTRGIVIPNILQATGSYIISDPKGNLYKNYSGYLRRRGYDVMKLDFTNPQDSAGYNFFQYIHSQRDIVKVAHMLVYSGTTAKNTVKDPFWDESSQILLQAIIAYLIEAWPEEDRNLETAMELLLYMDGNSIDHGEKSVLDTMMVNHEERIPDSYAVKMYKMFRIAADRTMRSILISVYARLGAYCTPELNRMMQTDELDIASVGQRKRAIFVVVSDTDRSMDGLANVFFTQAMNELCMYADNNCKDNRLPVPVRFILDDFATNCSISEFPRMIASIRSREISTVLMIQSESQLEEGYGADGKTIMGNCDTYVYLGGNDVATAQAVATRCDIPLKKILYMPVGTNWIFRRGEEPHNGKIIDLDEFQNKKSLADTSRIDSFSFMERIGALGR